MYFCLDTFIFVYFKILCSFEIILFVLFGVNVGRVKNEGHMNRKQDISLHLQQQRCSESNAHQTCKNLSEL